MARRPTAVERVIHALQSLTRDGDGATARAVSKEAGCVDTRQAAAYMATHPNAEKVPGTDRPRRWRFVRHRGRGAERGRA